MSPTRREFLAAIPAAALPISPMGEIGPLPERAAAPAVPPELVELARAYSAAAAHVLAIQPAYDRVCVEDRDHPRMSPRMRRFVRYVWDPATEAMDRLGQGLAEAIDRRRLDGVIVDGMLYLGYLLEPWAGCDHFPQYCPIVRVGRIAGLTAHHQRSTDR